MDTQQRTTRRRRPPQGAQQRRTGSQPAAKRRPAAKAPARRSGAGKKTDRARREAAARASRIKAMKQSAQKKSQRRVRRPRRPMEPVVYTQPKVFNRSRLVIQLISIMAVVMAVILCLSIFFRVEVITVSGANAYSAWAVRDASGIQEGDYLLTFSRARAVARIEAELPYVYSARIGIKLPNTVNIVIEEIDVVYAIQSNDGIWWLMTSKGQVMEQSDAAAANNYTKVLGVQLYNPVPGEDAVAFQGGLSMPDSTEETTGEEETTPILVTEKQKLDAALLILQSLELNEEVGTAASIDVSELSRIELWYGTRFQVNLGDTNNMDHKIASMKAAIASFNEYEMAMLDCSFTTWPDMVGYTPFE